MALIKKFRTKKDNLEHLIVDSAGSVLPLSGVKGEAVTINTASVASAEGVVWLNNNDPKQFAAVSGGQYYKDWAEFTYEGITYPSSSIYADKKAKALFRVGNSLMQCINNSFEYILADDLNQMTEYVDQKVADLVNGAPGTLDTLKELADALQENADVVETLNDAIGNKVTKVEGKGLSTNDYTDAEKNKVAGIEANFDSTKVPYNVVLPFSGSLALAVTVSESSAISPNGIFWSAGNNKFVARTGESSYTYHETWPACTIGEESFPASAYYTRADAKGKLYLNGNVSYAFVGGHLVPVGDGVGATIDLSGYYTKIDVDNNFLRKYTNSFIGNYVTIGYVGPAPSQSDSVEIGKGVYIGTKVKVGDEVEIANEFKAHAAVIIGTTGLNDKLDLWWNSIGSAQIGVKAYLGKEAFIDDGVHLIKNIDSITMRGNSGTAVNLAVGSETTNIGYAVNIGNRVSIENDFKVLSGIEIGNDASRDDELTLTWLNAGSRVQATIGEGTILGTNVSIGEGIKLTVDSDILTLQHNENTVAQLSIGSGGTSIGGDVTIGDGVFIGESATMGNSCRLGYFDGKMQLGYSSLNGVNLGMAMSLYLEQEGTMSYLVIKDATNNVTGKIAFSNGDVISTSVVSGDTLTV